MAGKLEVDTEGFRRRVAWRGVYGALSELVSNALDENVTRVDVTFEQIAGQRYRVRVEDDSPDGFRKLGDSYTLYADSYKACIPSKSGRFNYGEKVAIVLAVEATIVSMTGGMVFTKDGRTLKTREKRQRGTFFEGIYRCTASQYADALAKLRRVIVRPGVMLVINGATIPTRSAVATATVTLPTVLEDNEKNLIKTERKTTVDIYHVLDGEVACLYEVGIPICPTGDVYHADVRQKIPLSVDRNNVTPKYLKRLRAAVLDATYHLLTVEQSASKGVTDALALATPEAITAVMDKRFGENRFVPDFNREATGSLTAEGFTAVPTRAFDAETWQAVKDAGAIQSGNQLRPHPSTVGEMVTDETPGMTAFREFTLMLAREVLCVTASLTYAKWDGVPAQCGPGCQLTFNVKALGHKFFSEHPASDAANLNILFHELGHYNGAMDCTREHCNGVTKVASETMVLMQTRPELFEKYLMPNSRMALDLGPLVRQPE